MILEKPWRDDILLDDNRNRKVHSLIVKLLWVEVAPWITTKKENVYLIIRKLFSRLALDLATKFLIFNYGRPYNYH